MVICFCDGSTRCNSWMSSGARRVGFRPSPHFRTFVSIRTKNGSAMSSFCKPKWPSRAHIFVETSCIQNSTNDIHQSDGHNVATDHSNMNISHIVITLMPWNTQEWKFTIFKFINFLNRISIIRNARKRAHPTTDPFDRQRRTTVLATELCNTRLSNSIDPNYTVIRMQKAQHKCYSLPNHWLVCDR